MMQEPDPRREQDSEWWLDPRCHFGELTIEALLSRKQADLAPALDFLSSHAGLQPGARLLDLCCGPGWYSIELARLGFEVVGIDVNPEYIRLARQLSDQKGTDVEFLVGDMREIPFVGRFDLVINIGTSFGFFADDTEDYRVVEQVARSLRSGGSFVLEMANRDYLLKHFVRRDWKRLEDGSVRLLERDFDHIASRIKTRFEIVGDEGSWS
jgi:SAM-dependent methyltransferase